RPVAGFAEPAVTHTLGFGGGAPLDLPLSSPRLADVRAQCLELRAGFGELRLRGCDRALAFRGGARTDALHLRCELRCAARGGTRMFLGLASRLPCVVAFFIGRSFCSLGLGEQRRDAAPRRLDRVASARDDDGIEPEAFRGLERVRGSRATERDAVARLV